MKSIKLLAFGNSYSVDALTYLTKIFKSAGYEDVVIGHICDGGCNINQHWQNIDDTLECFHPAHADAIAMDGTAGCSITRNGFAESIKGENIKERYTKTIQAEDWDFVSIQHGPKHVEQVDTYSYLGNLLDFIKENLKSDKTKFVFHMIWKYNDNIHPSNSSALQYEKILDIAKNTVLIHPELEILIPAVTFRQNLISSYLNDVDIARDYGHMGLTLGRYALGLLWYTVLSGGSPEDVSYVASADEVSEETKADFKERYNHVHLEITEKDMAVIREAIKNAIAKRFEITQSAYTE
jgi:hypothetical protein